MSITRRGLFQTIAGAAAAVGVAKKAGAGIDTPSPTIKRWFPWTRESSVYFHDGVDWCNMRVTGADVVIVPPTSSPAISHYLLMTVKSRVGLSLVHAVSVSSRMPYDYLDEDPHRRFRVVRYSSPPPVDGEYEYRLECAPLEESDWMAFFYPGLQL